MATARQIAEAYFAAALDRGDLEDALRQLRQDVEFASPAGQIRGRTSFAPTSRDSPVRSPTRATRSTGRSSRARASRSRASTRAHTPGRCGCPTARNSPPRERHVSVPFVTLFDAEERQDLLAPRLVGRRHRHGPARTDALRGVIGRRARPWLRHTASRRWSRLGLRSIASHVRQPGASRQMQAGPSTPWCCDSSD